MKKLLSIILVLFLLVAFHPVTAKITGAIGNGRVVLRPDVQAGETKVIERTLLVRNPNDVPVDIELEASETITDIIDLKDISFTLQPGEEKEARFNIILSDTKSYEGAIVVFFNFEGKQGIALTSTIIIVGDTPLTGDTESDITEDPGDGLDDIEIADDLADLEIDDTTEITGKAVDNGDVSIGFNTPKEKTGINFFSFNPIIIFTVILVFILLILGGFVYLLRK